MFLISTNLGRFNIEDVIFQLILLVFIIGVVTVIISLIVMLIKGNKRLARIEEKIDKLSTKKEKL